jgi:hypothetical protein
VDPVPDPLLLRKSGSAGNRTRSSGSVSINSYQYYHITVNKETSLFYQSKIVILNIVLVTNVVLTCYSNVLTSGSPEANPESDPNYSLVITK